MNSSNKGNEERFYTVLPSLQDLLNHVMEEFDEYNPEFVRHAVEEANTIIDAYLGPMSFKYPRYAFFDHLNESGLDRLTGLAYLESFESLQATGEEQMFSEIPGKQLSAQFNKLHFGFSYQLYENDGLLMLEETNTDNSLKTYKQFNTYAINLNALFDYFENLQMSELNAAIIFSYDYFCSVFEFEEEDADEQFFVN